MLIEARPAVVLNIGVGGVICRMTGTAGTTGAERPVGVAGVVTYIY